jgi:ABC-type transport system involved in multi-copper enzyme maturation permease subunit
MKFLALLRDSLREATDSAVLYVTIGLTGLFLLLVASLSFRPVPVDEQVQKIPNQFNWIIGLTGRTDFSAEIVEFKQIKEPPPPPDRPWDGDYSFTLVFHLPTEKDAKEFGAHRPGGGVNVDAMRDSFEKQFFWARDVNVTHGESKDPKEVRFDVETEGSTIQNARDWVQEPTFLFFWKMPFWEASLSGWVYWIEDRLLNGPGSWACILTAVILTSFFVPNMLRKGTVDMLIVKPIKRPELLLYKYIGGLTFVFLNTAVAVGGLWLVLGLRTGIWAPGVLFDILGITFYFALLYAVSVLFGVLTRSPIVALSVTVLTWMLLWGVGWAYQSLTEYRNSPLKGENVPQSIYVTVDTLHFLLPRTKDLDITMTKVVSRNVLSEAEIKKRELDKLPDILWYESLIVSAAFLAVTLGLSCWWFATKDY